MVMYSPRGATMSRAAQRQCAAMVLDGLRAPGAVLLHQGARSDSARAHVFDSAWAREAGPTTYQGFGDCRGSQVVRVPTGIWCGRQPKAAYADIARPTLPTRWLRAQFRVIQLTLAHAILSVVLSALVIAISQVCSHRFPKLAQSASVR
jgi:hypothetical protein